MPGKYFHRLEDARFSLLNPDYIIYSYLMPDLKDAIVNYGKGSVLDVGCGNKPYRSLFSDKITEYVGCDVEQSNLEKVDKICPATDLQFGDNSFDTVFCTQVLEHVYDHKKALREIARVLKPGGFFIGSVPLAWPHHEEPHDFFRFTRYGLEELLRETGLEKEYIKPNGGKWALLGQMLILNFSKGGDHQRLLTRAKRFFFKICLGKIWVNLIFTKLDRLSSTPAYWNTLNFVFVARKPV